MWIFAANRYLALLALLEERSDEAEHLLARLARGRDEVAGEEIVGPVPHTRVVKR